MTDASADWATALSAQVTPVILTMNEAANIARCLAGLRWARRVVVVDSGSTDDTLAICAGFANVEVRHRAFDQHASQWNWAVHETGVDTDWVLALDADYAVNDDFLREAGSAIACAQYAGVRARFRYCIHGRALRASLYPPVTVLFRRALGRYVQDGHTQRVNVDGAVTEIGVPIAHDDRKPLSTWISAQDRYSTLECEWFLAKAAGGLTFPDRIRSWTVVAPWLVPLYCLLVRGLLLDGRAGVYYALQRGIAESMLALKLLERRLRLTK